MASVVAVVPAAVRVVEAAALPDPTFGVDGYADVGGEIGRPRKLSIGDDDKIVVVGSATPSYTGIFEFPLLRIERLLPNGAPDSTFGSNGRQETRRFAV